MSETMTATLIGSGMTLITTIITLITHSLIEKQKRKLEFQQKRHEVKREKLNDIYAKLVNIITQYPNLSPNDVLQYIEGAPNYSRESFDAVLKILDYQIEDYERQLENAHVNYKQRNDIEVQISNREYPKQKILEIRDKYYIAQENYKHFCESDKGKFELYAGQDVRNCLVEFEVEIHNVFISGRSVGNADDPLNNRIEVIRRKLIDSIRNDVGT